MVYEFHLTSPIPVGQYNPIGLKCSCGNGWFVYVVIEMAPSCSILSCTQCGLAYENNQEHRVWERGGTEGPSEQVKIFVEGVHQDYKPAMSV